MPDFHQPGPVVSLPLLSADTDHLEADLLEWTRQRPLALLLPCHVRDMESPALTDIAGILSGVLWVSRITIGLDGADEAQFAANRQLIR